MSECEIRMCGNPSCFVHDGETCALGEMNHKKCCSFIEANPKVLHYVLSADKLDELADTLDKDWKLSFPTLHEWAENNSCRNSVNAELLEALNEFIKAGIGHSTNFENQKLAFEKSRAAIAQATT